MSAHTPGPWMYQFAESGGYDCMTDSFLIVDAESRIRFIADVDLSHYGQNSRTGAGMSEERRAEAEANARLIAAAPELLAAAQMIVETCPCDPDSTLSFETSWRLLLAAIQSATGA